MNFFLTLFRRAVVASARNPYISLFHKAILLTNKNVSEEDEEEEEVSDVLLGVTVPDMLLSGNLSDDDDDAVTTSKPSETNTSVKVLQLFKKKLKNNLIIFSNLIYVCVIDAHGGARQAF